MSEGSNFIRAIVEEDIRKGTYGGRVVTRFPPEPNGYLHIGHAKAILTNYTVAVDYGGTFHLRFDDTNPETEETEYVEGIMHDIAWLGCDWGEHLYFASDTFDRMVEMAVGLIRDGKAYVCDLTEEQMREHRGTVSEPGTPSPYRDRSVEENLDLFRRMKDGEFPDGHCVLRAKIDMAHPNMKMRDPPLYRIRHVPHHRAGDKWVIYPMYDYAHPLEDAFEDITHSLCSLEFENNRAIYDWVIEHTAVTTCPRQYEFARLNLAYTVMSKRKLIQLVQEGHVSGWDDPRMPTITGMRRRGFTPEAIRDFVERVGVAKAANLVDVALLEFAVRNDLNFKSPRVMCVLEPLKVTITNWPEGEVEWLDAPYWPHDVPKEGSRRVPFSGELFIERADFMEDPPKKFFRLAPGREVRLRYGYFITCDEVVKDPETGEVVELRCSYDPATRGGNAPDGRRVKGTLHWVSAAHALPAEVRLCDRLFSHPTPDAAEGHFLEHLNPDSLTVLTGARVEPSVADDPPGSRYQFERQGYFIADAVDSRPGALVFNRTVTLKDTWAKVSADDAPSAGGPGEAAKGGEAEAPKGDARKGAPAPARELTAAQAAEKARLEGLGLPDGDAEILALDPALAAFFAAGVAAHGNPRGVANWVVNDVRREAKEHGLEGLRFGGAQIGALVALLDEGVISSKQGKKVFAELLSGGGDPRAIVEQKGWTQLTDPAAIAPLIDAVLARSAAKVEEYRGGRDGLFGFFVGQVLKESRGRANPEVVNRLLRERLDA